MSLQRETVLEKLRWRYAVKKFDSTKKIAEADWNVLEESLRLSPSSYGLQPWKFVVIQNDELRQKLRAESWNQSQVTDCSHFVVFLFKVKMDQEFVDRHIDQVVKVRGVTRDSLEAYRKSMLRNLVENAKPEWIEAWAQRQGYLAMGMMSATAAMLNIDTCPMEGLNPTAYDRLLNLENSGWKTLMAMACGYRHPEDLFGTFKKVRFDSKDIFEHIV